MKNLILKGLIVTMLLTLIFVSSYAQTSVTADTIKNTCGEGSTSDILFKVCDSTVMQMNATDYSVRINGTAYFDTIRAKLLHAGDSSIVLGTGTLPAPSFSTTDFLSPAGLPQETRRYRML